MRIAIPSNDNKGLEGYIGEHFGRVAYYVFVDIKDNKIINVEVEENPSAMSHAAGQIPQYLKSRGVDVVIAMGMGFRARQWFEQLGIKVITGAQGKIKDIIDDYLKGKLKSVPYEPKHRFHELY